MLRDSQRVKVYKAEEVLRKHSVVSFHNLQTISKWVDKVITHNPLVTKKYPMALIKITVGPSRSTLKSYGNLYGIRMRRQAYIDWVILHEVAHTLQIRMHDEDKMAYHDRTFTDIYLFLVFTVMGQAAYDDLRASFDEHEVDYTPPPQPKPKFIQNAMLTLYNKLRKMNT